MSFKGYSYHFPRVYEYHAALFYGEGRLTKTLKATLKLGLRDVDIKFH